MSEYEFPCEYCHEPLTVEDDYVMEPEGPLHHECAELYWDECLDQVA